VLFVLFVVKFFFLISIATNHTNTKRPTTLIFEAVAVRYDFAEWAEIR
jgi:hypothetical protein